MSLSMVLKSALKPLRIGLNSTYTTMSFILSHLIVNSYITVSDVVAAGHMTHNIRLNCLTGK